MVEKIIMVCKPDDGPQTFINEIYYNGFYGEVQNHPQGVMSNDDKTVAEKIIALLKEQESKSNV